MKEGEVSEAALLLSARTIAANPADYTAWHWRRNILAARVAAEGEGALRYARELELTAEIAAVSAKNYQLWQHRRACILAALGHTRKGGDHDAPTLAAIHDEIVFIEEHLEEDAKNYHAWTHRQWVITVLAERLDTAAAHRSVFHGEETFVARLIAEDVANNSAWSHAYYLCAHAPVALRGENPWPSREGRLAAAAKAMAAIRLNVNNVAPWQFLRGVLADSPLDGTSGVREDSLFHVRARFPSIVADVEALRAQRPSAVEPTVFLLDLAEEEARGAPVGSEARAAALARAASLLAECQLRAPTKDPLWRSRRASLDELVGEPASIGGLSLTAVSPAFSAAVTFLTAVAVARAVVSSPSP
jgi:protein farnesyltransferase/geranylgeranyltransferase type-1 subunit alpha